MRVKKQFILFALDCSDMCFERSAVYRKTVAPLTFYRIRRRVFVIFLSLMSTDVVLRIESSAVFLRDLSTF